MFEEDVSGMKTEKQKLYKEEKRGHEENLTKARSSRRISVQIQHKNKESSNKPFFSLLSQGRENWTQSNLSEPLSYFVTERSLQKGSKPQLPDSM